METAFRLASTPRSAAKARHATRLFLPGLPINAESVLLIVSELVANAIQHGTEPIDVRLAWDGRVLQIEVSDGDPSIERVTLTPPSARFDHGRGLALTDLLATDWGARSNADGKTVWATVTEGQHDV
jgi:anti-sigma regulatory factor (Ser/Thr protein kinase)